MLTTPPQPPTYSIRLLRHGQSVGNADGFHQGQTDYPLTDTGRQQARALAERWHTEATRYDLMIASPLARASETAAIIAARLDVPLTYDPIWMERDVGVLAGLRPPDAEQRFPRPDFFHPYLPIGQTGESQWELYLRAGQAVQSLINRPVGSYLVISHGGLLNMVLYAILGITPQANFNGPRFRFGNTSFATLTYTPDQHKWAVLGLNDHNHWPHLDE